MRNQKEKRLSFIQILVVILLAIIVIRLHTVMISQGDYYRDLSDNRKVKEVDDLASRGNIYDRNGKLLATSIPAFTIQIYKDELSNLDPEDRIKNISELVKILESDGINYTNDFAIKLNSFAYKRTEDYFILGQMPNELVVSTLVDNELVNEFISSTYKDDNIEYETVKTALLALKKRGIDIPCHVSQKNGNLRVTFKENSAEKLKSIGYDINDDPMEDIVKAIGDDKSVLLSVLENSFARKLAYDILDQNNLLGSIVLKPCAVKADEDFVEKKAKLSKVYQKINLKSKVCDDFYEIVKNSTINDVLTQAVVKDDGAYVIPADILIQQLENLGVYANFETEVITENDDQKN